MFETVSFWGGFIFQQVSQTEKYNHESFSGGKVVVVKKNPR